MRTYERNPDLIQKIALSAPRFLRPSGPCSRVFPVLQYTLSSVGNRKQTPNLILVRNRTCVRKFCDATLCDLRCNVIVLHTGDFLQNALPIIRRPKKATLERTHFENSRRGSPRWGKSERNHRRSEDNVDLGKRFGFPVFLIAAGAAFPMSNSAG